MQAQNLAVDKINLKINDLTAIGITYCYTKNIDFYSPSVKIFYTQILGDFKLFGVVFC